VGGDGTLTIAQRLWRAGAPIVGIPKTIDNDVVETLSSVGFDTAVSVATEAVDRLHATAEAHHRIMVLEVMGRYSGWLALHAGVAGGADVILIPEIPYRLDSVAEQILRRESLGARFSIVVVAEGARQEGGGYTVLASGSAEAAERLGGIGSRVATELEQLTRREARSVLLGHVQRGGAPTSADRLLATRFGARAMQLAVERRFGTMVSNAPPDIAVVPLDQVAGRTRLVPADADVVTAARAIGIVFGDAAFSGTFPRRSGEFRGVTIERLRPRTGT
jgi:6-phosphofructokinase 1